VLGISGLLFRLFYGLLLRAFYLQRGELGQLNLNIAALHFEGNCAPLHLYRGSLGRQRQLASVEVQRKGLLQAFVIGAVDLHSKLRPYETEGDFGSGLVGVARQGAGKLCFCGGAAGG
jgi:hypothetical protein